MLKYAAIFLALILIAGNEANAAGDLEEFIDAVKENNLSLKTARKYSNFLKKQAETGLSPQDPQVTMQYLFGPDSESGNLLEYEIIQSFDFPTAYFDKSEKAEGLKLLADLKYKEYERGIIVEARANYLEMLFLNGKIALQKERLETAELVQGHFRKKMELGEISSIAFNKATLAFLNVRNNLELTIIEKEKVIGKLDYFAGGVSFNEAASDFGDMPELEYDSVLNNYTSRHPAILSAAREIEIKKSERAIANAGYLPKFNIGYHAEHDSENMFSGFILGMSLPLWENNNKGQAAELAQEHSEAKLAEARNKLTKDIQRLYSQYSRLKALIEETGAALAGWGNIGLLTKAVEAGEISATEYYFEIAQFYEAQLNLLELQLELHRILNKMVYV